MKAKFHAEGTLVINIGGRKKNTVYGDIIEGVIKKGMHIYIPLNKSFNLSFEIEGIEFIDKRSEQKAYVCLVLKPETDTGEYTELLETLNIGDEILEITDEV
ncbi:MAG: hypothetical protein GY749_40925 [Desulfobacteraceae bacterium]|nr:hypothetical protein [Desulfobacteraceae bacterium]